MKKYLIIVLVIFLAGQVSTGLSGENKPEKNENVINLLRRSAKMISSLDPGSSGTPAFLKTKKRITRHLRRISRSSSSKLQKNYLWNFIKCLEEETFESIPEAEFITGTETDLIIKYDKKNNSLSAIALKTLVEETKSTDELFDKIRAEIGRGILERNIRFFPGSNVIKVSELVYPENIKKKAFVLNSAENSSKDYPGVILLKNVLENEYENKIKPIAKQVLREKNYKSLDSGLFLRNIFLHHLAHYTIPFSIKEDGKKSDFRGAALKELLLDAEEVRADLTYLTIISLMDEKNLFKKNIKEEVINIFILEKMDVIKNYAVLKKKSPSSTIITSLFKRGGLGISKSGKKLVIDQELLTRNIKDLESLFNNIFEKGSYGECKSFFRKYSEIPENLKKLLKIPATDKVE